MSIDKKSIGPDSSGDTSPDVTPGGLFSEGGTDVQANATAAGSAARAEDYARDSQGWAVGSDSEALDAWSDTNNSKYYAEQAKLDSEGAASSASSAASSATAAADSAMEAQVAAAEADDEADRSKSWAVGPSGANESGTDTDNAKYWSEQASGHNANVAMYARAAKSWADGDSDLGNPVAFGNDTDNAEYWSGQSADSATASAASASEAAESAAGAKADSDQAAQSAAAAQASADEAEVQADRADSERVLAQAAQQAAATSAMEAEDSAFESADSATNSLSSATASAQSATESMDHAEDSQGWAVGNNVDALNDWSANNNAMYWANQAQTHANRNEGYEDIIDITTTTTTATLDTEVGGDPLVFLNGVALDSDEWSISGTTITMVESMYNGDVLVIRSGTQVTPGASFVAHEGYGMTINEAGGIHTFTVNTNKIVDTEAMESYVAENGGYRGKVGSGLDTDGDMLAVDTDIIADTEWVKSHVGNGQLNAGLGLTYPFSAFTANSGTNHTLDVDTDMIADTEWVKDNFTYTNGKGIVLNGNEFAIDTEFLDSDQAAKSSVQITGTSNLVQVQHQYNGVAEAKDVWYIARDFGLSIDSNFLGNRIDIGVDTEVIADTEWVKGQGYITTDNNTTYTMEYDATNNTMTLVGSDGSRDSELINISSINVGSISDETLITSGEVFSDTDGAIATTAAIIDYVDTQVSNASNDYVSINSTDTNVASATGLNAIAIGAQTRANNVRSISIGFNTGDVGTNGTNAIAIGVNTNAQGGNGVAIGHSSNASGEHGIAIGDASAGHADAVCLGDNANSSAAGQFVLGSNITEFKTNGMTGGDHYFASIDADGIWSPAQIGANAISNSQLADNAVSNAKIANATIQAAKIASQPTDATARIGVYKLEGESAGAPVLTDFTGVSLIMQYDDS